MYFHLRCIKTHKFLSITGSTTDVFDLVDDDKWATAWDDKQIAATRAGEIMDDFSHELAGITLEVVRG